MNTQLLSQYKSYGWCLQTTHLCFWIEDDKTRVTSHLVFLNTNKSKQIFLHGEELELLSVVISGVEYTYDQIKQVKKIKKSDMQSHKVILTSDGLYINTSEKQVEIKVTNLINPTTNTSLKGLYQSGDMFCTQCEAEGFRRITYYPDRPDVLSRFTVEIYGLASRFKYLLSNGNCVNKRRLQVGSNTYNYTKWQDPHPKPCYLFALIAGNLIRETATYTTSKNKKIDVHFYTEHQFRKQLNFAKKALKQAMAWDEQRYKRFYDLNLFQIVAVSHFNMGAMENKGLNVFNANSVVADQKTATDTDITRIKTVVAHEYFHNWSGNRVTCRDWFQLSIKEGLTVFRENLFSEEVEALGIERVEQMELIRSYQFSEDASPLAHPVRPHSYQEIDNFYTSTVYDKGSEIIRMLWQYLGDKVFTKGLIKYFKDNDGKAVTVEDFLQSLDAVSNNKAMPFLSWYNFAGTPYIKLTCKHTPENNNYNITATQLPPAIFKKSKPRYGKYQLLPVPVAITLYDAQRPSKVLLDDVLLLCEKKQTFNIKIKSTESIIPVFFKNFSAPVNFNYSYSLPQLQYIGLYSDPCSRRVAISKIMHGALSLNPDSDYFSTLDDCIAELITQALGSVDNWNLFAMLLTATNNITLINNSHNAISPIQQHNIREQQLKQIADIHFKGMLRLYKLCVQKGGSDFSTKAVGARSLKATLLSFLIRSKSQDEVALIAYEQYKKTTAMSDKVSALMALNYSCGKTREEAFGHFYQQHKDNQLLMQKWLRLQAAKKGFKPQHDFKSLTKLPIYDKNNPNCLYSLYAGFHYTNFSSFHASDGSGYKKLFEMGCEIDAYNPLVGSAIFRQCLIYKKFDQKTQKIISKCLTDAVRPHALSTGSIEILNNLYDYRAE